jgi:DNA-binding CsgD family transcriptional regulator/tetratricopeptide (TPR) repeat protein
MAVSFDLLLAMEVGDWAEVTDALEEATAAGILREEPGGYLFTHALLRQTLLEELSLPRRQRMHLRAATALEQRPKRSAAETAALADHYRQAGAAANPAQVRAACEAAARQAEAVYAWEDAATLWQAALDAADATSIVSPEERCELLLALGQALWHAGLYPAWQETFLSAARAGGTPEQQARAALGYAEVTGQRGELATAIGLLEKALATLDTADSVLRARLLGTLAEKLAWGGDEAAQCLELSAEALRIARRVDDARTLAYSIHSRLWMLPPAEHLEESARLTPELVELAERLDDADLVLKGHRWRIGDLVLTGQMAAADRAIAVFTRLVETYRHSWFTVFSLHWREFQAIRDGRFADLQSLWQEHHAFADPERPLSAMSAAVVALHEFGANRWAGRPEASEPALRVAAQTLPNLLLVRAGLALLLAESGQAEEARAILADLATTGYEAIAHGALGTQTLALLAQAAHALAEQRTSAELYPLLLPYAGLYFGEQGAAVHSLGAADRFLALLAATLGRDDDAERHFTVALELNLRTATKPALADTQRQFAAFLLARGRRGDMDRARTLLEHATAGYTAIGLEHWAGETRALLTRLSASTPPRPTLPGGLSAREVEVLRLLAEGKSNPEIAAVLVISRYTVDRHINHIFSKIGASNRVEAAAFAHREGLAAQ